MTERRRLGTSGYEIGRVGLGTWQIGGPASGWPAQPDEVSVAAIRAALDLGVDWIDTAPAYGCGRAEELVGRALAGLAERPLVFTKCGLVWDGRGRVHADLSREAVRADVEASLRRLRVDALDLVQVHWPVPDRQIEEAWETLVELRDAGLVRALGASNFDVARLERVRTIAPVASLQPPYSLLRRDVEEAELPYCAAHGIGVLVYSPLESGLLTVTREHVASLPEADQRRDDPRFREPRLSQQVALAERLREVGARRGRSGAEVALAWALRHRAVTGAIVGVSRPEQAARAVAGAGLVLDDAEAAELEAAVRELVTLPRPPGFFPAER